MNHWLNLDYRIFEFFNAWASQSKIFDFLVVFLGHYLPYVLGAALVIYWFAARDKLRTRKELLVALISFVVARLFLVEIIRKFWPRNRPFLSHQVVQLIAKDAEKSFPSGHAAALFAIATAIYFYDKRLGRVLFIITILISLARVIAGVHYPTDIIGGAVLGIVVAWAIDRLLRGKIHNLAAKLSGFSDKILPFIRR